MHHLMSVGPSTPRTRAAKLVEESSSYDFPVSLEDAYTRDGVPIPKVRVVMRGDTRTPLAAVSNKYLLVPHQEVISHAERLISGLGNPERKFFVTHGGAGLIGTFTYKEHLRTVKVGDQVDLRVYFENSYNTKCAVKISIGALVLSCSNGMVSSRAVYSYTLRHLGTRQTFLRDSMSLPDPGEIMYAYERQAEVWKSYADYKIPLDTSVSLGEDLIRARAMPSAFLKSYRPVYTVWDAMQQATYFVTHKSPRLSPGGRMDRLARVSAFFEDKFKV